MRLVLLGNAGSGKTTMAKRLARQRSIAHLSLDELAWARGVERRPLQASVVDLHRFVDDNEEWIVEGCYGDLVEAALPHCTELKFLNPGVEVCVDRCKRRGWEPEKFASPREQAAHLEALIDWVRRYPTRIDEYGLERHRRIFEAFDGPKKEYTE